MSFQEKLKKFFRPKPKEEEKKPKTFAEKVKEFFKQLLFAAIAAFFIITFIIQNTRIPTGSMEETILVGDFVLVNKFIYGSSSPKYIPFTEIELPYFRLPAFKDPKPKDIV
ncbi:MAG TPA: S26 family signal peptidase, partial [Ignavibacteriaceae bacterium]|nr:S26 family signal peptidase [Ignavibacteriaceae bacterium]